MELKIKLLKDYDFLKNLNYQTAGSAGLDLCAAIDEPMVLLPGEVKKVSCGIAIELPQGYEAQVRSRSGLALKNQIVIFNSPATIDSDYRGEVFALLKNFSPDKEFVINPGIRVAQMIITKYEKAQLVFVGQLSDTVRGEGGFGSTGL